MRVLTDDELLLISGGYGESDVTVTHPPYEDPGYTGIGGGGDSGGTGGGGSGGGDNGTETSTTHPTDDCAAKAIAEKILAKPDSRTLEYRGFIYNIGSGPTYASDVATSGQQGRVAVDFDDVGMPSAFNLMASVHNHPIEVLQDPRTGATEPVRDLEKNSLPSYIDIKGMYDYAHAMRDAGITNWQDYKIYIVSGTTVREFRYSDQDWSKLAEGNLGPATWAKSASFTPCS
jgi:hypothetical protein